jgi:hypothetical protein
VRGARCSRSDSELMRSIIYGPEHFNNPNPHRIPADALIIAYAYYAYRNFVPGLSQAAFSVLSCIDIGLVREILWLKSLPPRGRYTRPLAEPGPPNYEKYKTQNGQPSR